MLEAMSLDLVIKFLISFIFILLSLLRYHHRSLLMWILLSLVPSRPKGSWQVFENGVHRIYKAMSHDPDYEPDITMLLKETRDYLKQENTFHPDQGSVSDFVPVILTTIILYLVWA